MRIIIANGTELNQYAISKTGAIFYRGKILKTFDNKGAANIYKRIKLRHNGIRKAHYVHRLVAETYIGSIPDGHEIDHLDGNTANNHVENLEIVTKQVNIDRRDNRVMF